MKKAELWLLYLHQLVNNSEPEQDKVCHVAVVLYHQMMFHMLEVKSMRFKLVDLLESFCFLDPSIYHHFRLTAEVHLLS